MGQEAEIAKALEEAKSAHNRIDSLEKKVEDIHELASAMAAMKVTVDNLTSDVGEIKAEVKKVSERPVQWWDKLVAAALGAIASGIIAAILANVIK